MYTVIDLFCGAGGFSYGFKKAGFNILLGIDFEEHKLNTYSINIKPQKILHADISNLTTQKILENVQDYHVTCLIGSPPCNDFSNSNKYHEIKHKLKTGRPSLPYHFYRLLATLRPTWLVTENVDKFFIDTLGGELFYRLCESLGYNLKFYNLCSADFGVPQKRNRGFLIGNNLGIELNIPPESHKHQSIRDAISDLENLPTTGRITLPKPLSNYQKERRTTNNQTENHDPTDHKTSTIDRISKIRPGQSARDIDIIEKIGSKYSGAYYRPHYDQPARTITTRFDIPTGDGDSIHPVLNRCFTPREAARIQSFDDSFIFYGGKKDIQKQIGDAVPPLLSYAIAKRIKVILDVTT